MLFKGECITARCVPKQCMTFVQLGQYDQVISDARKAIELDNTMGKIASITLSLSFLFTFSIDAS